MTKQSIFEVFLGSLVLIVALFFGAQLLRQGSTVGHHKDTYLVKAFFQSVDGLKNEAPVTVSGVPIGYVKKISLDAKTLLAEVHLHLFVDFQVPEDSSASVSSKGILGGKLVTITPGNSQSCLKDGDILERTQGALNLERMVSQFVFGLKR